MTAPRPRTTPEWITFTVTSLVLAIVIGLLVVQAVRHDSPADPVVEVDADGIQQRGDGWDVPVRLRNEGHRGAANVQVVAELATAAGTERADQTIDVVGAGETVDVVFVFAQDPAQGELTVGVAAFTTP